MTLRNRLREFRLLLHELPPILKELEDVLFRVLGVLGCGDLFWRLWHR
jgi:hypothetical protein